jgi:PBSX family phage portal protein
MKRRKPFAIITDKNKIVTKSVYDRYAIKGDSKKAASEQIFEDAFSSYYKENDIVKPLYNFSALANLTEINSYHQSCVNAKAQDIAGNGYQIKPAEERENKEPSEEQKKVITDIFQNQWPPLSVILRNFETDYQSIGNGYLELVREGDLAETPYALISHIPGYTMRVCRDRNRYVQIRGTKKRWFKRVGFNKDVDKDRGIISELGSLSPEQRASEIIHDYNYTSRSDFYGLCEAIAVLGAIQGNLSQRDYNIKFFENFGIPAYAVYIAGDYDLGEEIDEEVEDSENDSEPQIVRTIRKYLDKVQSEPHSNLVFGIPSREDGGKVEIKFVPLAIDIKDASFRMYRKDNRDEIISAHRVPPYRIGINETGSLGGNTAKESTGIYIDSVVNPRQSMIEAYINKFILRDNFEIYDWVFRLNDLDTQSEENDRETLDNLFKNGGASPNDLIRNLGARFGIKEIDDPAMNAHYINGIPITNLGDMDLVSAQTALQSLQNKLIEIAKKNEAKRNEKAI